MTGLHSLKHVGWVAAALTLLAITLLSRAHRLDAVDIGLDEGAYVAVAHTMTQGHLPYTQGWDNKPPLLHALFALALALSPSAPVGVAVLGIVFVWLTALSLALLARQLAGLWWPGWLAGLLYVLFTANQHGHTVKAEFLFNLPVVLGFVATAALFQRIDAVGKSDEDRRETRKHEGDRAWRFALLAGLSFGVAMQIKPVVMPEFLLCCLITGIAVWKTNTSARHKTGETARHLALLAAGLFAPLALIAGVFYLAGQWQPYVYSNFLSNMNRVDQEGFSAIKMVNFLRSNITGNYRQAVLWIGCLAAIGQLVIRKHQPTEKRLAWIGLAWLAAAFAGVCSMRTFFDHAFYQMLTPLCLLTGCTLALLIGQATDRTSRIRVVAVVLILLLPQTHFILEQVKNGLKTTTPEQRLVQALQRVTEPGDTLYVAFGPTLAYPMTDTVMPSPYAGFQHFIWWSEWSTFTGIDARDEFQKIQEQQPAVLVVTTFEREHQPGYEPDAALRKQLRIWIESDYQLAETIGPYEVYRATAPATNTSI